jgi:predicted amidohydrolase
MSVGRATETSALDVMESNLQSYEEIARLATASGAQIIVFPEWGLFGKGNPARDREAMQDFCETIDGDTVSSPTTIVGQISALAAKFKVAITANVCEVIHKPSLSFPGEDKILYNTEVAFDSDGSLLAKYHKNHPWYTSTFDTPPEEVVSFTTSFGVTFGLFVCYDLVHSTPEDDLLALGVTQFPYSVAEPATLAGREYFEHWTKKHKATLLASNLGNSGSGIFVKGVAVAMVDRGRSHNFAVGQVVVS